MTEISGDQNAVTASERHSYVLFEAPSSMQSLLIGGVLLVIHYCIIIEPCLAQQESNRQNSAIDKDDVVEVLPVKATHTFTSLVPISTPPVDLGDLPVGKQVNVVIEVRNESGSNFRIKGVRSSCNCMSVKTSAKEIIAGESISLLAELKVPKLSTNNVFTQLLMLDGEAEGTGLQIVFKYQLQGLCCFKELSLNRDIPKAAKTIPVSLPILITDPVDVRDVSVIGNGDFSNVNGRIEKVDGGYVFRCDILVPELSGESLSLAGEFTLKHKYLDLRSSVVCVFGSQPKMSLLPSILQFVKEGDDWSATAIVKLSKDELKSTQDSVYIAASFGRIPVVVEEKKISHGIVRVRVRVKNSDVFDGEKPKWAPDGKVHFQVGWEGGIAEKDVAFVFK